MYLPLTTGVAIQSRHIGFAGATTSAVTGFYGRTGNAALISTDDISVQNISGVGNLYIKCEILKVYLTYEDVTNVDSIGIITARTGVVVGSGITLKPRMEIYSATGVTTCNDICGALQRNLTGIDTAISGAQLTGWTQLLVQAGT